MEGATIGSLYIDGLFECLTLEDEVRSDPNPTTPANEAKVAGKTAIPTGTYQVVIDMSPRFKRLMPHILNVPGFEGIRFHSGNKAADTEGCILLGQTRTSNHTIGQSKLAYEAFFKKLQAAGTAEIEIV